MPKESDRVRSEWRCRDPQNEEVEDAESTPHLPEQAESLSDKMNRFFTRSADKSMCSSSDVVAPSNPSFLSRNIFSDEERKFLL